MSRLGSPREGKVTLALDPRASGAIVDLARQIKATVAPAEPPKKTSRLEIVRNWAVPSLALAVLFVTAVLIITTAVERWSRSVVVSVSPLPKDLVDAGVAPGLVLGAIADRLEIIARQAGKSAGGAGSSEDFNDLRIGIQSTSKDTGILSIASSLENAAGISGASAVVGAIVEILDRIAPSPKTIEISIARSVDQGWLVASSRLIGFSSPDRKPRQCVVAAGDLLAAVDCLALSFAEAREPLALAASCLTAQGSALPGPTRSRVFRLGGAPEFLDRICSSVQFDDLVRDARRSASVENVPRILNIEGREAQARGDFAGAARKFRAAIDAANLAGVRDSRLLATLNGNLALALASDARTARSKEEGGKAVMLALQAAERAVELSSLDQSRVILSVANAAHIQIESCRTRARTCGPSEPCPLACDLDAVLVRLSGMNRLHEADRSAWFNWVWGFALRTKAEGLEGTGLQADRASLYAAASERFVMSFKLEWEDNNIARRDAAQTALLAIRDQPDRAGLVRAMDLTMMYLEFDTGGPYRNLKRLLHEALMANDLLGQAIRLQSCYDDSRTMAPLEHSQVLIRCLAFIR